ncbi:hypothetical protein TWF788_010856 [Orbilia oligospora]|uniref:Uncharacterized protein n=1 Tax=Orbilia oligospora TaxID=2813651 RepID=A0A7C8KCP8_ORBOL|nr:hypothetical protein TWF788_010856 [Orbilia oligospora]
MSTMTTGNSELPEPGLASPSVTAAGRWGGCCPQSEPGSTPDPDPPAPPVDSHLILPATLLLTLLAGTPL